MLILIPLAIVLAGFLLRLPFGFSPRFVDPDWRDAFSNVRPTLDGSEAASQQFYEAHERNLTEAAVYLAHGSALVALGLALLAMCAVLRLWHLRDLRHLKTPSRDAHLHAWVMVAWWSLVPASALWFDYQLERGDFPPWADNIAIPVTGTLLFCLAGTLPIIAGVHLAARNAELPVGLWTSIRGTRGIVASILAVGPLCWYVLVGFRAFREGDIYSIPVAVVGIYATLITWATAKANRRGLTNDLEQDALKRAAQV